MQDEKIYSICMMVFSQIFIVDILNYENTSLKQLAKSAKVKMRASESDTWIAIKEKGLIHYMTVFALIIFSIYFGRESVIIVEISQSLWNCFDVLLFALSAISFTLQPLWCHVYYHTVFNFWKINKIFIFRYRF